MDTSGEGEIIAFPHRAPAAYTQDAASDALTRIHSRIHCAATDAVEDLQVEAFLDTLAEIAQAIAQREQAS